jgi:hypothetical protein
MEQPIISAAQRAIIYRASRGWPSRYGPTRERLSVCLCVGTPRGERPLLPLRGQGRRPVVGKSDFLACLIHPSKDAGRTCSGGDRGRLVE